MIPTANNLPTNYLSANVYQATPNSSAVLKLWVYEGGYHCVSARWKNSITWPETSFPVNNDRVNQWAPLTVNDFESGRLVNCYVSLNDLSRELGIPTTKIKVNKLGLHIIQINRPDFTESDLTLTHKFGQKVAQLKEFWSREASDKLRKLCEYIEDHQTKWQKKLIEQPYRNIMKFRSPIKKNTLKSKQKSFSVYVVRGKKTGTFKTFLNLGKKYTLGSGTFKTAYMAINFDTLKPKALIKANHFTPTQIRINDNEAWAMRLFPKMKNILQTPYIDIIEKNECEKQYMFTTLCELGELFKFQVKHTHISEEEKTQITKDVLGAMITIHNCDYVHRDLKPHNIFIYRDKMEKIRAKVADLGMICPMNDIDTGGNRLYMSPEKFTAGFGLLNAHLVKPADAFSLGLILFELHMGSSGFSHSGEPIKKHAYYDLYDALFEKDLTLLKSKIEEKYLAEFSRPSNNLELAIFGLIDPNPIKRLTIKQAYEYLYPIS